MPRFTTALVSGYFRAGAACLAIVLLAACNNTVSTNSGKSADQNGTSSEVFTFPEYGDSQPPTTAPNTPGVGNATSIPKPNEKLPTTADLSNTPAGAAGASLSLPRIPWNGGSAYYQKFPSAVANGWTDPNFFPIGIWWDVFSSDAEVKWDSDHGINTYIVTNNDTQGTQEMLTKYKMSYIGGQLPGMSRNSKPWVGDFLDDEVDGRFDAAEGLAFMKSLGDKLPDHNKIRYANFTEMVVSWLKEPWNTNSAKYVNNFTDATSMDSYWYSVERCSWPDPQGYGYLMPFTKDNCRTANNYGRMVDAMRKRDALDGKNQAIWQFIENVPVNGNKWDFTPIKLKGAAWQSVIHGATGLVWFNNSFEGNCATGNAIRTAQRNPGWECASLIKAMGEVNNQIKRFASVLNTQSFEWSFGTGVSTMLKAKNGYAYIFAGTDGTPGTKTFTLPQGISGTSAEVMEEGRTLTISGGKFTDNFPHEATTHIYRVRI